MHAGLYVAETAAYVAISMHNVAVLQVLLLTFLDFLDCPLGATCTYREWACLVLDLWVRDFIFNQIFLTL